jgi:hypothetical protein
MSLNESENGNFCWFQDDMRYLEESGAWDEYMEQERQQLFGGGLSDNKVETEPVESLPFTYVRKLGGDLIKVYFGDSPEAFAHNLPIRNGELQK